MEENKKFLKGFLCGLCVTVVCGLAAYFISVEIFRQVRTNERSAEVLSESSASDQASLDLDSEAVMRKMMEIEGMINRDYLNAVNEDEVEAKIYKGLIGGLEDPYAAYYTKEELAKIQESTSGSYSGIGARMIQDRTSGIITIVDCFEGSPAAEAGVLPGDILYKVGETETTGMDLNLVVSEIKEPDSKTVHLTLVRDGESDYIELDVEKKAIDVPTVYQEMLEEQIGYIQITEFDSVTVNQFESALEELSAQGMQKLVIDLRNNPGGVLQVTCKMLNEILPKGMIVYTEDKYGKKTEYKADGKNKFNLPLVLLVNENSASASEIFAGAVKDYKIGTILGVTTYGKGIVQRIETLSDGTAIKLTVENYYTPNGNNIHGVGIEPDVKVELDEKQKNSLTVKREDDNQLQAALSLLKGETPQTESQTQEAAKDTAKDLKQ